MGVLRVRLSTYLTGSDLQMFMIFFNSLSILFNHNLNTIKSQPFDYSNHKEIEKKKKSS